MHFRFILAIVVVAIALSGLMFAAVENSSAKVVTVAELQQAGSVRERVRLGARVADAEIDYQALPQPKLRFAVRDIVEGGVAIPVLYYGVMPDTLRNGRDVIVEGRYDGKEFIAVELLTQCPSKYVPPAPKSESKS